VAHGASGNFAAPGVVELKNTGAATLKGFLNLAALPRVQCSVADPGLSLDMDTPEDYKTITSFP